MQLHNRFSANPTGWAQWVFEQFDMPADGRVLELGCGSGALWTTNQDRIPDGWHITLTDCSKEMLDEARHNLDAVGRTFDYQIVDAQDIPLCDESVDAVIANHMLYHVSDRPRALAEIRRVLRPGGRLYATTNGSDHMRETSELMEHVGLPVMSSQVVTFTLENGSDELLEWFAHVEMQRYEDGLHVTEIQPVVDYILSMPNVSATENQLSEIRRIVGAEITRTGAYCIAKSSGMFIARREGALP